MLSVRSEFLGRALTELADASAAAWPRVLLDELTDDQLLTVVLAPSVADPLPYSSDSPVGKYRISFDPGVPQEIVRRAKLSSQRQGTSAIAEVQAIGALASGLSQEAAWALVRAVITAVTSSAIM